MSASKLLLSIAVVLPTSFAAPPCSSSHADDVAIEGCFGWCSPIFAAEHCTHCKCKGCPFCHAAASVNARSAPSTAVAPTGGTGTCSSGREGDAAFADCASFCTADYKADHCGK